MTTDEIARLIVARFAAPYGEFIMPGAKQQIEICARQAARDIQAALKREEARVTPLDPLDRSIRDRHICDLYASGMSMEAVAREVGMTRQGVLAVLQRREQRARTVRARERAS